MIDTEDKKKSAASGAAASSAAAVSGAAGSWADEVIKEDEEAEEEKIEVEEEKIEVEVEVEEDEVKEEPQYDQPMDSVTEAAWSSVYPEEEARSVPVVTLNLFFVPLKFSFCLQSLQVELIETLGKICPALKTAAIDLRLDRRCLCATCLQFKR